MTQPPTSGAPGTGYREGPPPREPSWLDRFFDGLRGIGIRRRRHDKWLGGVCSGLADRLGVDPLITRAGFILLGLLFGFGVTLYLVAWVLLPDTEGEVSAERALRDGDAGSVILLVIAGLVLFSGFTWWGGGWGDGAPWGLLVIGLLAWWAWAYSRGRAPGQRRSGGTGEQWGQHLGEPAPDWGRPAANDQHPRHDPGAPTPPSGPQGHHPPGAPNGPEPAPSFVRPRRRSMGFLGVVVAVGLGLVAYGGVQWADDHYGVPGNAWSIGVAAALAAFGAFLLVLGLAGRKGGFVSFLAIVGIVVAVIASLAPPSMSFSGQVRDRVWAPTSLTTDTDYSLGAGRGVLDLTNLPADGPGDRTVHVSINAGDLRVVVPDHLTTEVDAHVGVGDVSVTKQAAAQLGGDIGESGFDADKHVTLGDGPVELRVVADVGIGSIHVDKE